MLLAGSVKLVGMARSTCKGRRRPTLPTYAICSDDRDVSWRAMREIEDVRVWRLHILVQSPVDGESRIAREYRGIRPLARGRTGSPDRLETRRERASTTGPMFPESGR